MPCTTEKIILRKNCIKCLEKILNYSPLILFKQDHFREDFLFKCVKFDRPKLLEILLNHGILFHESCAKLNTKKRSVLLESIIILTKKIVFSEEKECLDVLLENCQNIDVRDIIPLKIVLKNFETKICIKYLKKMIDYGFDSNLCDEYGNSLLHIFFQRSNLKDSDLDLFLFLIQLKIDVNLKNNYKQSALDICTTIPNIKKIYEYFIISCGELNLNDIPDDFFDRYAPIHRLVYDGNLSYFQILTERCDVDVDVVSSKKKLSPLHLLCNSPFSRDEANREIVLTFAGILLEDKKAKINMACSLGYSPLDYAEKYYLEYLKEYLVKEGACKFKNFPKRLFGNYKDVIAKLQKREIWHFYEKSSGIVMDIFNDLKSAIQRYKKNFPQSGFNEPYIYSVCLDCGKFEDQNLFIEKMTCYFDVKPEDKIYLIKDIGYFTSESLACEVYVKYVFNDNETGYFYKWKGKDILCDTNWVTTILQEDIFENDIIDYELNAIHDSWKRIYISRIVEDDKKEYEPIKIIYIS